MDQNSRCGQSIYDVSCPLSFRHLPVTSLENVTHNFEQLPNLPHLPVTSFEDVTRNFEALGITSHQPIDSLEAITRNFEALEAKGALNG